MEVHAELANDGFQGDSMLPLSSAWSNGRPFANTGVGGIAGDNLTQLYILYDA